MKFQDITRKLQESSAAHQNDRIVQKHINFFGMPVCVEIIAGGVKYSVNFHGKPWQKTMKVDYGYFDGVTGSDGDYLDCYIASGYQDPKSIVCVVKQMRPDGTAFDEHKVIIGCMSELEAEELYKIHCHTPECYGGIKSYSIDEFRKIFIENQDSKIS